MHSGCFCLFAKQPRANLQSTPSDDNLNVRFFYIFCIRIRTTRMPRAFVFGTSKENLSKFNDGTKVNRSEGVDISTEQVPKLSFLTSLRDGTSSQVEVN